MTVTYLLPVYHDHAYLLCNRHAAPIQVLHPEMMFGVTTVLRDPSGLAFLWDTSDLVAEVTGMSL